MLSDSVPYRRGGTLGQFYHVRSRSSADYDFMPDPTTCTGRIEPGSSRRLGQASYTQQCVKQALIRLCYDLQTMYLVYTVFCSCQKTKRIGVSEGSEYIQLFLTHPSQ